jgi:hypothetical protein
METPGIICRPNELSRQFINTVDLVEKLGGARKKELQMYGKEIWLAKFRAVKK